MSRNYLRYLTVNNLTAPKFTLSEVSKESALVERKAREHLHSVMYHNLKKVDVLYNIALCVRILNLASDKARLFKAVLLRHDCVHCNGFDNEGKEIDVFTKPFVQETADLNKTIFKTVLSSPTTAPNGLSLPPLNRRWP